ncbi:aldo/keto reductase [Nostoc sp.]|uniref:aldo/keto reductase n=1 Tax=Nostoc sp. TaxID=1180 RepID=UPI002FEF35CE
MVRRKLGRSELEVSPLCFGGNVFGWTINEDTSFKILDHFIAAGGNFIDTADVYSKWASGNQGGESETILGKWLKQRGNREQVVIATHIPHFIMWYIILHNSPLIRVNKNTQKL